MVQNQENTVMLRKQYIQEEYQDGLPYIFNDIPDIPHTAGGS